MEKPLVLPRASVTLVPTTTVTAATTTLPSICNTVSAITLWPSTSSASANLFVNRSWPKPLNEGITPMSVPEEKQEMKALDPSKYKPSKKGDSYLPPSTFSHTELCHGQSHCSLEYTIPGKKVQEMGDCHAHSVPNPPCTPSKWNQTGQRRTGMVRYKRRRGRNKGKRKKWSKDKKKKGIFWIQAHQNPCMYPTTKYNTLHW